MRSGTLKLLVRESTEHKFRDTRQSSNVRANGRAMRSVVSKRDSSLTARLLRGSIQYVWDRNVHDQYKAALSVLDRANRDENQPRRPVIARQTHRRMTAPITARTK